MILCCCSGRLSEFALSVGNKRLPWFVIVTYMIWALTPLLLFVVEGGGGFFLSAVVVCVGSRAVCPTVLEAFEGKKMTHTKTTKRRIVDCKSPWAGEVEPGKIEQKKRGKEIGGKWVCAKGQTERKGWWSKKNSLLRQGRGVFAVYELINM